MQLDTGYKLQKRQTVHFSNNQFMNGMLTWFDCHLVRGHVSEKSFLWAFYEHFSFFTETYSLNGIESTKRCPQFFEGYVGLFYAN